MHRSVNVIVRRSIFAKMEEAPNEATFANRTYLLCLWARPNYAGVGYARSYASYTGRRRWGSDSGQRRPRTWAWAWAWVGPPRRSWPPLRLVSGSPLRLAASSPLVVIPTDSSWRPLLRSSCRLCDRTSRAAPRGSSSRPLRLRPGWRSDRWWTNWKLKLSRDCDEFAFVHGVADCRECSGLNKLFPEQ